MRTLVVHVEEKQADGPLLSRPPEFIMRMCLQSTLPLQRCTICLEDKPSGESPCQLPCVHFICGECLPKVFTPRRPRSMRSCAAASRPRTTRASTYTCPTCRHCFPRYALVPANGRAGQADFALCEFFDCAN